MPETLEVVPDNTVDAPNPEDFDTYVARRQAEANPAETDPADDTPEPDPEPVASEPAKPETPAAEVTPQPETPAPASETGTKPNQEEQVEREKKGIPQSRFDEVTKARRDAERERDAERDRAVKAERELAELKAKPAEPAKPAETPAPAAETKPPEAAARPTLPDPPTLEDKDGDWDAYQAATKEYFTKTLPEFQDKLTDWKLEQREAAQAKAAKDREEADKKAKTEADAKTAREAEELAQKSWKERFEQTKAAHPDIEEKILKTPGTVAMITAIQDSDNGTDLLVWLTDHPEDAKRIADVTGFGKTLTPPEMRRAIATAHREFAKLDITTTTAVPPNPPAAETAPAVQTQTQPPKPPENQKPAVSRAPKPPPVVSERSNVVKSPSEATDFAEYERLKLAQVSRR